MSNRDRVRTLVVAGALLLAGGAAATTLGMTDHQTATQAGQSGQAVTLSRPAVPPDRALPALPANALVAAPPSALPRSLPVRIEIPRIDVAGATAEVGRNPDGTLEVPAPGPPYDLPAWYRHSPTPGERGPAVVVGHLDRPDGSPSVFYRLGELAVGDAVVVRRADGHTATFAVTATRQVGKTAFPTREVYGDLDRAALRLLTCGGPLDPVTGDYRDNVVVLADLVDTAGPAVTGSSERTAQPR